MKAITLPQFGNVGVGVAYGIHFLAQADRYLAGHPVDLEQISRCRLTGTRLQRVGQAVVVRIVGFNRVADVVPLRSPVIRFCLRRRQGDLLVGWVRAKSPWGTQERCSRWGTP